MNKQEVSFKNYSIKPVLIDAAEAHQTGRIQYEDDGTVLYRPFKNNNEQIRITPDKQYPTILPALTDLSKALSRAANSPLLANDRSLREQFDSEFDRYNSLVEEKKTQNAWEPDYGTYVYDKRAGDLYLVAPEYWHRLSLVTSPSKLLTDPEQKLSWQEIRGKLDNAVIGFVGASVGGNIMEGVAREVRSKQMKIADPDWPEATNLSRLERGSLRHLIGSRADRTDLRDPFSSTRPNKAEVAAYEQHLVDPYADIFVYKEGIHKENIEKFLLGDTNEPQLDVLVEEVDNLKLKIDIRRKAREYGIPVLMLSDFGHRTVVQFQDYKDNPNLPLGYNIDDKDLLERLKRIQTGGKKEDLKSFIEGLCGTNVAADEFDIWLNGTGEQPTSSLPQSGATALAAGGIGGKEVGMYLLGHKIPERTIYDLKRREVI